MTDQWRDLTELELMGSAAEFDHGEAAYPPNLSQRILIAIARNSLLSRGNMRKILTRLIIRLGGGKPLDIEFRGCKFRISGRGNLVEYGLLLRDDYNQPDLDFLLEGLKQGDTFVDIGCNIGLYTLPLARRVGPKGKTICIDANPNMTARLKWNAQASGLKGISVYTTGVSDISGRANLKMRKNDLAIVRLEESADGHFPVRTLQSIIEQENLTKIHALKIDVEGHEDKILVPFFETSAAEILPKRIVIESVQAGCQRVFKQNGYILVGHSKNNQFYLKSD
ncbi:MAG: FkbM family methyltransferase [Paracoccaceae bacterium]